MIFLGTIQFSAKSIDGKKKKKEEEEIIANIYKYEWYVHFVHSEIINPPFVAMFFIVVIALFLNGNVG
jgi:hypothetical protein